jgi:hypothetical protein
MRNVRLGRFELFVADAADVSLHDTTAGRRKAMKTLLARM